MLTQYLNQARQAEIMGKFMGSFLTRHPEINVTQVHDSLVFQRLEDVKIYEDELEEYLNDRQD
jgi:hypothetical protein